MHIKISYCKDEVKCWCFFFFLIILCYQTQQRKLGTFSCADIRTNNTALSSVPYITETILSHHSLRFPAIHLYELWALFGKGSVLPQPSPHLYILNLLCCAFGFARVSVWCSDTSVGTADMRLKQFTTKKLEPDLAPVRTGQGQAWVPDGRKSVITILWCKMRHWLSEIILQILCFVCVAECSAGIVSFRHKFLVYGVWKGLSAPLNCSNIGVGVCCSLCGIASTSLIKNRMEMDKDNRTEFK